MNERIIRLIEEDLCVPVTADHSIRFGNITLPYRAAYFWYPPKIVYVPTSESFQDPDVFSSVLLHESGHALDHRVNPHLFGLSPDPRNVYGREVRAWEFAAELSQRWEIEIPREKFKAIREEDLASYRTMLNL